MTRRTLLLLATTLLLVAGLARPAAAQSVNDAVDDLRSNDVTFEDGAPGLTSNELARLDAAANRLSQGDGFFKVVVLASPVEDFDSPREFAESILSRLGGNGRVLVYDTDQVGIASTLDTADEIARAEEAAADEANRSQSYAEGLTAAAQVLGVSGSSGGGSSGGSGGESSAGSGSSSGSGAVWILVVVVLAVLALVVFLVLRSRKKAAGPRSTVSLGEGEMKVRHEVDRAGNLILELADRVELAGAPPEAKQLFSQGAAEFADLQDDLEQADTHEELEAVYPKIVDAVWKLDSAKALVDDQPAPSRPQPGPLFPVPPPPPTPVAAPAGPAAPVGAVGGMGQAPQGYRSSGVSPWLTTAATAALTMLVSRSMAPQRSYRPPAADDYFSGGGRGSGRRRSSGGSGGINLSGGSSGRGMGRRR